MAPEGVVLRTKGLKRAEVEIKTLAPSASTVCFVAESAPQHDMFLFMIGAILKIVDFSIRICHNSGIVTGNDTAIS
jgi:hypothetical protein